jgi:hypothetical protein
VALRWEGTQNLARCSLGRAAMQPLIHAFRSAALATLDRVSTAEVLAGFLRDGISTISLAGNPVLKRRTLLDVVAVVGTEKPGQPGVDPWDWLAFASTGAVREAKWRGVRVVPATVAANPEGTGEVVAAVRRALAEAQGQGLSIANAAHLLIGLATGEGNDARLLLDSVGLDAAQFVDRVRNSADYRVAGAPWVPAVRDLGLLGAISNPGLGRLYAALVLRMSSKGAFGPFLYAASKEMSRQAVLLGRTEIWTADVILAVDQLDVQLALAGHRTAPGMPSRNTAATVLAQHGFRYDLAVERLAHIEEAFTPHVHQHRDDWPRARRDDPRWGQRVVEQFDRARADSAARGHRDTGTTHLLAATLAEPDSSAVHLLRALSIDVNAVRVDLEHDLRESGAGRSG